jgi:hypothetical protein
MRIRSLLVLPVLALACSGESQSQPHAAYSEATLAEYLQAMPDQERLSANLPTAQDTPGALTQAGNAVLAAQGVAFARAVNRPVRTLVTTLRLITAFKPSFFDAEAKKFVWGPWDNEDGVGQVALYVQKNGPGADFEYSYALLRAATADLEDATPVIAGGTTPDPDDRFRGVGVTLWDLEANHQFDLAHDPAAGEGRGRGRFVTLFGHQTAEGGDGAFNLAVFRSFVAERELGAAADPEPIDVDYFYGRWMSNDGVRVDFVDSEVLADLCDASAESCFENDAVADADERLEYDAFFINRGLGRAEARVSAGDLSAPVRVIECWNPGLNRTSFQIGTDGANGGEMVETMENGSCAAPADQSPSALGLPTLDGVEPALLEAMSCAAERGLSACD